jgi:hypothetical protein
MHFSNLAPKPSLSDVLAEVVDFSSFKNGTLVAALGFVADILGELDLHVARSA